MRRAGILTLGAFAASTGTFVSVFSPPRELTKRRREWFVGDSSDQTLSWVAESSRSAFRFARSAFVVAYVTYNYTKLRQLDSNSESYRDSVVETHRRCAERVLRCCRENQGIFIKIGQYVSTLSPILPSEWTETLKQLQDKANYRPFEEIAEIVLEDLGIGSLDEVFVQFDETPVAAASLAQVHRATLRNNRRVAVKVQYAGLSRQVAADLWTLNVLLNFVSYWFGEAFEFSWLLPEIESMADVELDFRQELENAERMRCLLRERDDIYIPETIKELSGRRVLTMEFIDAMRFDEIGTTETNLDPRNVASTILGVFGDMIFQYGFIHCDPHGGNLMVRSKPNASDPRDHQVVLLDHGMYRRIEPEFRIAFCNLWCSLLTRDRRAVVESAAHLGMNARGADALSLVLTFRGLGSRTALGQKMSKRERRTLRERYRNVSAERINNFVRSLPRDMLFVLRTMSIVRSLNRELGGTTKERLLSFAECAVRGRSVPVSDRSMRPSKTHPIAFARRPLNKPLDIEAVDVSASLLNATWIALSVWAMRLRVSIYDALLQTLSFLYR